MEKLRLFNFGPKLYNKLLITYPQLSKSTLMFNNSTNLLNENLEERFSNLTLGKINSFPYQSRQFNYNTVEYNLQNQINMQSFQGRSGGQVDPNFQMLFNSKHNSVQQSQIYPYVRSEEDNSGNFDN
jgi:hypothetical protein